MNLDEKIQFFFKRPEEDPVLPGKSSTLYLLRRDISMCFGIYPTKDGGAKIGAGAIWPGVMAILAGIDLLGKFYAGDDSTISGVGARYKVFTEKYIDQSNSETLYQLRNALLHSFGLYSKTRQGKEYRFILSPKDQNEFIKIGIDNKYFIDVKVLWKKFEKGVVVYFEDILKNPDLQNKFNLMFDNYGSVWIGP